MKVAFGQVGAAKPPCGIEVDSALRQLLPERPLFRDRLPECGPSHRSLHHQPQGPLAETCMCYDHLGVMVRAGIKLAARVNVGFAVRVRPLGYGHSADLIQLLAYNESHPLHVCTTGGCREENEVCSGKHA
jgi:hypothetical protein